MTIDTPKPTTGHEQRVARTVVIRPRRSASLAAITEIYEFRQLFVRFAKRDIILRYRQTALGVVWVILQPLLGAGVLSFVFGSVANLPAPAGIPYFVFAYFGFLGFGAMSGTFTKAAESVRANAAMVTKIFFPRAILPMATCGSTAVDFAVSLGLGIILLLVTGVALTPRILLTPLVFLMALLVGLGPGLVAAALMVRYRDVQYIVPVGVQMFLFASPVAYQFSTVPGSVRPWLRLNPGVGVLEAIRWCALGTSEIDRVAVVVSLAVGLVGAVAGLAYFTSKEQGFADVI